MSKSAPVLKEKPASGEKLLAAPFGQVGKYAILGETGNSLRSSTYCSIIVKKPYYLQGGEGTIIGTGDRKKAD
jgi:hypothetical protein